LWFIKGRYVWEMKSDGARSVPNDRDKRFHPHGQSEEGILELEKRFSEPGRIVLDPFRGGGTTGVACLASGRRFIGADIDRQAVETTRGRDC
jgi:DNA modification methylase